MIDVTESTLNLPTEDYPYNVISLAEVFVEAVKRKNNNGIDPI